MRDGDVVGEADREDVKDFVAEEDCEFEDEDVKVGDSE